MNWIDFVIIGVVALSAVFGLVRGFVREALALAGWVLALWVALSFAQPLSSAFLSSSSIPPALSVVISFVALFAVTFALTSLVNYLVTHLINRVGLSATDRAVGMLFGIARGGVIVALSIVLVGMTDFGEDAAWKDSMLVGPVENMSMWVRELLGPQIKGAVSK